MIESGRVAPKFKLPDQNGELVSLAQYKGKKNLILYFYPKALTPGCSVQAQGLRDTYTKLKRKGYEVLGVSCDTPEKLQKFVDKYDLPFKLLSDESKEVVKSYGVWGRKKFMGKEYDGIFRTTFVIDKNGKVKHVMDKVKTKTHHEDLLEILASKL